MQSKVMRYLWLFLTGLITHSLLIWMSGLNPALANVCDAIYAVGTILWCLALLFNGPLQVLLGIDPETYLMMLVGSFVSCILAAGVTWILG